MKNQTAAFVIALKGNDTDIVNIKNIYRTFGGLTRLILKRYKRYLFTRQRLQAYRKLTFPIRFNSI